MAKDYNVGDLIPSDNTDGKMYFEDLRWALNKLLTDTNRRKGVGKSSFANYDSTKQSSVSSTITSETSGTSIAGSPFSAGVNVIQDLLKKGYMKPAGTTAQQTAANNIKNAAVYGSGVLIPSLTDFFTVVNYWRDGSESSPNGCNGACTGYCSGTCAGANTNGTHSSNDGGNYGDNGDYCAGCNTVCTTGCGDYGCRAQCLINCYNTCESDCYTVCDYCKNGCEFGCKTACKQTCKTTCTTGCTENCRAASGYTPA